MSLTPQEKSKLIEEYKAHDKDTGSSPVQVGLLTTEIKRLLSHLKKHPKDIHSKRGLLKMVAKRRRLLNYLQKESPRKYGEAVRKLGLKR